MPPESRSGLPPALVIIAGAVLALVATLVASSKVGHRAPASQVQAPQTARAGSAHSNGSVSPLTAYSLVYADAGADVAIAPFAGTHKTLQGFSAVGYPDHPVRTGQSVGFIRAGKLNSVSAPFQGDPVAVADADHLFPALKTGLIGVYRKPAAGASATLQLVAVQSQVTDSAVSSLPDQYLPVAELPSGFLLWQQPTGLLQVWRPSAAGTDTFVRPLGASSGVAGTAGDRVAWLAAGGCSLTGECPLHIADAASGADVTVDPPAGYSGFLAAGAFSPTNPDVLAVFLNDSAKGTSASRLALVTLSTVSGRRVWTAVVVPSSDVLAGPGEPGYVAWTPDGKRLLFSGRSGRIHDYGLGEKASAETEQPASYSFAVVQGGP
jgi:hypothetical protein